MPTWGGGCCELQCRSPSAAGVPHRPSVDCIKAGCLLAWELFTCPIWEVSGHQDCAQQSQVAHVTAHRRRQVAGHGEQRPTAKQVDPTEHSPGGMRTVRLGDPTPEQRLPPTCSFVRALVLASGCSWGGGGPRPGNCKGEKQTYAGHSRCCKATPILPHQNTSQGSQLHVLTPVGSRLSQPHRLSWEGGQCGEMSLCSTLRVLSPESFSPLVFAPGWHSSAEGWGQALSSPQVDGA